MQAAAQITSQLTGQLVIPTATVPQLDAPVTGRLNSLMARVFGCRHADLSRPFSRDGRTYRSCLHCGAQRQFNLGNWKMQGGFYYGEPQTRQMPAF